MRTKITFFLTLLLSFSLTSISWGVVTLPYSTSFDCPDWVQNNNLPSGDRVNELARQNNSFSSCGTGDNHSRIEIGGNNPLGYGKGFRYSVGDGTNNNGDSPMIELGASPVPEIYVRWYMRWPAGFRWNPSLQYQKLFYISTTGHIRIGCIDYQGNSPTSEVNYTDQGGGGGLMHGFTNMGWYNVMKGATGDGVWHYYEVHFKTDTNRANGVLQMWIDGVLRMDLRNVNFFGENFSVVQLMTNQKTPANGGCLYVDIDDIAVRTAGPIGPLGGGGSTSPVMYNGSPINNYTYSYGTTQVTMSLNTDVNANCKYDTSDVAYSSMANTFSTGQGSTSHTQNITGLQGGYSYTYYARCDVASGGQPDTSSMVLSWNVSTSAIPPVLSSPQPANGQVLPYNTTQTTLGIHTDKLATCRYDTSSKPYASMSNTFSTDISPQTVHSGLLTGLTNGNTYYYYIRCNDGSGGINLSDYSINFSVASTPSVNILLNEGFEDANFTSRGWYDGPTGVVDCEQHAPVSGSNCSLKLIWASGAQVPSGGPLILRHKFTETDSMYVSYWIKHTANWAGSGVVYHPHMFYFLTNLDGDYASLARDYLNVYIEENCSANNSPPGTCAGNLRVLTQDSVNIDTANINVNLVGVTENRAIAGCNGDTDGYDNMQCYQSGGMWYNGKTYPSSFTYFQDTPGVYYKNDWHFIEVYFKLNSISNGIGQRDGIIELWYDGVLVYAYDNVVFRTGKYPTMKFNQIVFSPYIGVGSPVNQQGFWIDNLTIGTSRNGGAGPLPPKNLVIQ